MDPTTRRALLLGGASLAGGLAVGGISAAPAAAQGTNNPYIWALNTSGFVVPSDTWVKVSWPFVPLNTTTAWVDPADKATIVFPRDTAQGVWAFVACIAWDNGFGPDGKPITPPTHRKLIRVPQQSAAAIQNNETAYPIACTDLTYHADLAARGGNDRLADGMKGYQQQQVYVQPGVRPDYPDQRVWVEVYQNSGQPLMCRFDGSSTPKTATRPAYVAFQGPQLMVGKLCDY